MLGFNGGVVLGAVLGACGLALLQMVVEGWLHRRHKTQNSLTN
jgi:hypothetical protein